MRLQLELGIQLLLNVIGNKYWSNGHWHYKYRLLAAGSRATFTMEKTVDLIPDIYHRTTNHARANVTFSIRDRYNPFGASKNVALI